MVVWNWNIDKDDLIMCNILCHHCYSKQFNQITHVSFLNRFVIYLLMFCVMIDEPKIDPKILQVMDWALLRIYIE